MGQVSTLVSNTNTSMSCEEGEGFGLAMLDFVNSLAERKVLPQVLSLSLGSLSPYLLRPTNVSFIDPESGAN